MDLEKAKLARVPDAAKRRGPLKRLLRPAWIHLLEQDYRPGAWLGPWVNPYYAARRGLWLAMRRLAPKVRGRILDVGCGSKPYQSLFSGCRYEGLELDTPQNRAAAQADHFYQGRRFPFGGACFDAVVANQVLEHVFHPEKFLGECARVLRPGGLLLLTAPFAWDEHHQPQDRARYTRFGLRHLVEGAGFTVLELRQTGPGAQAALQLLGASIWKSASRRAAPLRAAAYLGVVVPLNLLGAALSLLPGGDQDLYLDNVLLAAKPRRRTQKRKS